MIYHMEMIENDMNNTESEEIVEKATLTDQVTVVGVKFNNNSKIYYFDPDGIDFDINDGVIVETVRGVEFGYIMFKPKEVSDSSIVKPLKKVIRKATKEDFKKLDKIAEDEKEAFKICNEKILKHGIDMKLTNVEYTFDGKRLIFNFTADDRVDFRELVKDLASVFRTRIELRQIGVRDEARMIGGLGSCGRPCCCAEFLNDFQPVSIKMAKEQNLSLSPTKISGLCGRLMCCLNYENDNYVKTRKKMPKIGSVIETIDGNAEVVEHDILKERVRAKIELPDGSFDARYYDLSDIKVSKEPAKKTPKNTKSEVNNKQENKDNNSK